MHLSLSLQESKRKMMIGVMINELPYINHDGFLGVIPYVFIIIISLLE